MVGGGGGGGEWTVEWSFSGPLFFLLSLRINVKIILDFFFYFKENDSKSTNKKILAFFSMCKNRYSQRLTLFILKGYPINTDTINFFKMMYFCP